MVSFTVPTGNFGDVLAGWYAAQMGAPIRRLVVATNENDILARFFASGDYRAGDVVHTLSPSMDIQVASNFERYLYYRLGESADRVKAAMHSFKESGSLSVPVVEGEAVDPLFCAGIGDRASTLATIAAVARDHHVVLDPHTAVGVHVAKSFLEEGVPMICLATAHPAKFSDAIREALDEPARHEVLDGLLDAETRCTDVPGEVDAVKRFIARQVDG
jgi:threonine synthase